MARTTLYVAVVDPESAGTRILAFDPEGTPIPCPWRLPVRAKALHVGDHGDLIYALSEEGLYRSHDGVAPVCVLEIADAEGMCVAGDSVWMTLHNGGLLIRWQEARGKEVVTRGLQFPRGIAVADDVVYVAESVMGSHGYVRQIHWSDGDEKTLVQGLSGPTSLRTSEDGRYLFALESTSGTVARIRLDNGNTERLTAGLEEPLGIDVLRGDIYAVERVIRRRRFSSLSSNLGASGTVLGRLVRRSNVSAERQVLAEGFPDPLALCIQELPDGP